MAAAAAEASLYMHAIMGATPYTQQNDQYSFSGNTWTSKTDTGMTARAISTAVGVNEVVYAQGGYNGSQFDAHAKYTLGSDAWANLTSMVHTNYKKIGARLQDDYYITGGVGYGGTSENKISTDKYTKATNAVTNLTNLSSPFTNDADGRHTGFTAGGNLYVATGWEGDPPHPGSSLNMWSKECREYSVSGNSWSTKTDCNTERADCAGVSPSGDSDIGNVIGGDDDAYAGNHNEQYSVSGNTWTNKLDMLYSVQHVGGADA